ncbi:hypothetical protein ACCO45_009568 [Purpureocillium lilacinum]|uniref:Uncharacterized protein n=1 Tax=Purpureocillium lilacinum TaxID=33203 RepID=A0ACC4DK21_PURLI
MAQPPPLRRRDRNSRLDDDYYYHPSPTRGDGINGGDPYGPPPRRHKSERRGRPVPDFGPDDAFSPPRRSRRNRSPDPYEFKKPAAGAVVAADARAARLHTTPLSLSGRGGSRAGSARLRRLSAMRLPFRRIPARRGTARRGGAEMAP